MTARTQADAVLDYLRNTGPLDQFTAKDELGLLRLGARIWDLKQRGYAIRTELIEAPTEYGGTHIAQYSLVEAVERSEPRTLDEALWTFGERSMALGQPPTVTDYRQALGAASKSVAHRWLRAIEREGYIAQREGRLPPSDSSFHVTPAGYERLYLLERQRRIGAEDKS